MAATNRRGFVDCVGRGMLFAGLGTSLSADLGFSTALADEGSDSLSFGQYDALVDLLQSKSPNQLQPLLVEKLKGGQASLRELMSASALTKKVALSSWAWCTFFAGCNQHSSSAQQGPRQRW